MPLQMNMEDLVVQMDIGRRASGNEDLLQASQSRSREL
jgi:hypothetical protein